MIVYSQHQYNTIQYNTIQHSLFNEGNVINPMSYLTYGLHNLERPVCTFPTGFSTARHIISTAFLNTSNEFSNTSNAFCNTSNGYPTGIQRFANALSLQRKSVSVRFPVRGHSCTFAVLHFLTLAQAGPICK